MLVPPGPQGGTAAPAVSVSATAETTAQLAHPGSPTPGRAGPGADAKPAGKADPTVRRSGTSIAADTTLVADPASPAVAIVNVVLAPAIPIVQAVGATHQSAAGASQITAATPAANIVSIQGLTADIGAASLLQTSPAGAAEIGSSAGGSILASPAEAAATTTPLGADLAIALAPAAAPAQTAPAAATSSAAPGSVARQVAPALIQVAHGPSGSAVTLQLDPLGLGHVQVRVDRNSDGTATIQVTAERPETLRLLVADQPHLHTALDSAGVATDGRSLSFALATPGGSTFGGADGGNANGSNGGQAGSRRNGRGSAGSAGSDDQTNLTTQPAWIRAGVDITA